MKLSLRRRHRKLVTVAGDGGWRRRWSDGEDVTVVCGKGWGSLQSCHCRVVIVELSLPSCHCDRQRWRRPVAAAATTCGSDSDVSDTCHGRGGVTVVGDGGDVTVEINFENVTTEM
ncbi:unnamed protein product [Cuscuta epithymum]|uniref:Uncharacterized protein n=1 Tax=Cuscuta epithymum TaxID=186058 RepID=A0AAV0FRE8_9ASTE|nr:unnamed protein product [Cuscuta epithymum]